MPTTFWSFDFNQVHFDLPVGRELNRSTGDATKPSSDTSTALFELLGFDNTAASNGGAALTEWLNAQSQENVSSHCFRRASKSC